jgi:hypothetical protein
MSTINVRRAILIFIFSSIALQGSLLFGQASSVKDSVKFSVLIAPPPLKLDTLKSNAMRSLYNIFKGRGAVESRAPDWLFCLETREMTAYKGDLVVVSITTLRVLPKEAIEAGKREELFYSSLSAEKRAAMPKEGKWVREMVSEEMLRQYGMPVDQDILIVKRDLIDAELSKFADKFYSMLAQWKQ